MLHRRDPLSQREIAMYNHVFTADLWPNLAAVAMTMYRLSQWADRTLTGGWPSRGATKASRGLQDQLRVALRDHAVYGDAAMKDIEYSKLEVLLDPVVAYLERQDIPKTWRHSIPVYRAPL